MYYISVDCGGTKTAFVLANELGVKLADCVLGPGNFLVTGVDKVTDTIVEGVNLLCEKVNIKPSDLTMVLIASAGYNTDRGNQEYDEACKEKYKFNYSITSDVSNAMKGSLLDNEGIHLIAGTGSIGKGFDGKEVKPNVGGWGYYCGSDEGSGYWIGAKLLNHFERQADGREERTLIYDYIMNKYNLKNDREIITVIIKELENKRDKIATLAKDTAELCKQGDEAAKQIMFEAGLELAKLAKAIYKRDHYSDPVTISYSGSVFKSEEYLRPGIEEELKDIPHIFRAPILSPLAGGILLAIEQAGNAYTDETIDNLKNI